MEELAAREVELFEKSAAPSTVKARAYQARSYERFCNSYGLGYLPCDPQRVATYIAFLSFFIRRYGIICRGCHFNLRLGVSRGLTFQIFL